ncbi:MAG: hypothetical protein QME81_16680 [bacterium]|nr:hypothetical protein [bacterium]
MAESYLFKPGEVESGLKRLGFKILSGRGKGDHIFLIKPVVCQNNESHTAKAIIDTGTPELHPKAVKTTCERTGLTEEKLKLAIKGKYSKKQYEQDLRKIPKINLLSPQQKAGYLKNIRKGNL